MPSVLGLVLCKACILRARVRVCVHFLSVVYLIEYCTSAMVSSVEICPQVVAWEADGHKIDYTEA